MTIQGLPITNIINVTYNFASASVQAFNTNSLLILGESAIQGQGTYTSASAVAGDYGTTSPEYLAAANFFSYSPQPQSVQIGRWYHAASSAYLNGAPLTSAQQAITNFTSITNGGVNLTFSGTAKNLTALNFSAATNLNGVASIITTALGASGTCTWNANTSQFVITSAATGATATIGYATTGAGTDISGLLGLTQAAGATVVNGAAAETALAAVQRIDANGQYFFGLTLAAPDAVDADTVAIAGYIETTNHVFFASTNNTANFTAGSGVGATLQAAGYKRTCVTYNGSTPYAGAALAAVPLTVNYAQAGSANTVMFKQLPGITADTITPAQAAGLTANRVNYFVNYQTGGGLVPIVQNGVMSGPAYIDEIVGIQSIIFDLQAAEFNLFLNLPKVDQDDAGMDLLNACDKAVFDKYVAANFLGTGVWNGTSFGALQTGQSIPGYYVYRAPIATQLVSARAARQAVPGQHALKLAGAVQSSNVLLNVNR